LLNLLVKLFLFFQMGEKGSEPSCAKSKCNLSSGNEKLNTKIDIGFSLNKGKGVKRITEDVDLDAEESLHKEKRVKRKREEVSCAIKPEDKGKRVKQKVEEVDTISSASVRVDKGVLEAEMMSCYAGWAFTASDIAGLIRRQNLLPFFSDELVEILCEFSDGGVAQCDNCSKNIHFNVRTNMEEGKGISSDNENAHWVNLGKLAITAYCDGCLGDEKGGPKPKLREEETNFCPCGGKFFRENCTWCEQPRNAEVWRYSLRRSGRVFRGWT